MATYRPKTSPIWEHFKESDDDDSRGLAVCNYCNATLSYRTSTSNLKKHLNSKHAHILIKYTDDDKAQDSDTSEDEQSTEPVKNKMQKSGVWEYFDVKDETQKLASCKLCSEQFSYRGSLEHLGRHLNRKHSIEFQLDGAETEYEETDIENETKQNVTSPDEKRSRAKDSIAWEYFNAVDLRRKVASCKICGALCSYRTTVSNLMKHVRAKHIGQYKVEALSEEWSESDVETTRPAKSVQHRATRSLVWFYFKCLDPDTKLSQCLICKKTISHSGTVSNLKKHLTRKHPHAEIPIREDGQKRILLSTGGELYEVDSDTKIDFDDELADDDNPTDNLPMDTVYLEDFDALENEPSSTQNRKLTAKATRKRKTDYTNSSDEEHTRRETHKYDSYDYFAKYITSLLKQMPRRTANRLQANFVKQIMDAQLCLDTQRVARDNNEGFAITIASDPVATEAAVNDLTSL